MIRARVPASGWVAALGSIAGALGCHGATPAEAPIANRGAASAGDEIRAIDWRNHTYHLDELGAVTVKNGEADLPLTDDNKLAGSGAPALTGGYHVEPPLFADIDGDGHEDAIISGVLSMGGTGHFSEVAIYAIRGGKPVQIGAIPGGDRGDGGISHVALDGSAILIDRNVLGEGDGLCCPSGSQRERWIWKHGEMVEDTTARQVRAAKP